MSFNTQKYIFDINAAKIVNPGYIKRFGLENNPPFGLDPSTDEFAWKVFQFQLETPLVDDGVFGPKTYKAFFKTSINISDTVDYIFFDGTKLPINAKVITPNESGGMTFEDYSDRECYSSRKNLSKVKIIAIHHDATFNASQAFKIMVKRGVSTGWNIDPDGTIYQYFSDPAKFYQYATGKMNQFSIPFDVSTVADPTYAYYYKQHGMKVPAIITKKWNGKNKKVLALFPEQQVAAFELIRVLAKHLSIPIRVPKKGA